MKHNEYALADIFAASEMFYVWANTVAIRHMWLPAHYLCIYLAAPGLSCGMQDF